MSNTLDQHRFNRSEDSPKAHTFLNRSTQEWVRFKSTHSFSDKEWHFLIEGYCTVEEMLAYKDEEKALENSGDYISALLSTPSLPKNEDIQEAPRVCTVPSIQSLLSPKQRYSFNENLARQKKFKEEVALPLYRLAKARWRQLENERIAKANEETAAWLVYINSTKFGKYEACPRGHTGHHGDIGKTVDGKLVVTKGTYETFPLWHANGYTLEGYSCNCGLKWSATSHSHLCMNPKHPVASITAASMAGKSGNKINNCTCWINRNKATVDKCYVCRYVK